MGIKISELNELTRANDNDIIPIVDTVNEATKKITKANLLKELKKMMEGTILYENVNGTTGGMALNDSIENYNRIIIEFKTNDGYIGSGLVNNGKANQIKTILSCYNVDTNAHGWIKLRGIKISEEILTNEGYAEYVLHDSSITASNYIYITKITGYQ